MERNSKSSLDDDQVQNKVVNVMTRIPLLLDELEHQAQTANSLCDQFRDISKEIISITGLRVEKKHRMNMLSSMSSHVHDLLTKEGIIKPSIPSNGNSHASTIMSTKPFLVSSISPHSYELLDEEDIIKPSIPSNGNSPASTNTSTRPPSLRLARKRVLDDHSKSKGAGVNKKAKSVQAAKVKNPSLKKNNSNDGEIENISPEALGESEFTGLEFALHSSLSKLPNKKGPSSKQGKYEDMIILCQEWLDDINVKYSRNNPEIPKNELKDIIEMISEFWKSLKKDGKEHPVQEAHLPVCLCTRLEKRLDINSVSRLMTLLNKKCGYEHVHYPLY